MLGSRGAPALRLLWRRLKQPPGAAHEGIAALKKAKQFVGRARDADAHALADAAHGVVDRAKPEFFLRAEIDSVVAAIDLQGFCETPGPRVRSRSSVVLRCRCMISIPSSASSARIKIAAA